MDIEKIFMKLSKLDYKIKFGISWLVFTIVFILITYYLKQAYAFALLPSFLMFIFTYLFLDIDALRRMV